MRLVLDPEACAELREAAFFYERSRAGLGQAFLDAIDAALEEIRQHPALWRQLTSRFRRHLVRRFPYAVVYAVEGDTVYVAAVMHMKRKPGHWKRRAGREPEPGD